MRNVNLTSKCAIVIPTMNKSSFIEDKLFYFNEINYKGTIHIADSSDVYHFEKTVGFVNFFSLLGLKIVHHDTKGLNIEESKYFAVKNVKELYCQYCGDDDYILIDGLCQGIRFLENNKNFNSITGNSILVNLSSWGDNSFVEYKLYGAEATNLTVRLEDYSKNYWPIWVLHRTSFYLLVLKDTIRFKTPHFREIFMGLRTLSFGLCKKLPYPYLIRGIHDNRFHFELLSNINKSPDFIFDLNLLREFLFYEIDSTSKEKLIEDIIGRFSNPNKTKPIVKINLFSNFILKIKSYFFYLGFVNNYYYLVGKKLFLLKIL